MTLNSIYGVVTSSQNPGFLLGLKVLPFPVAVFPFDQYGLIVALLLPVIAATSSWVKSGDGDKKLSESKEVWVSSFLGAIAVSSVSGVWVLLGVVRAIFNLSDKA